MTEDISQQATRTALRHLFAPGAALRMAESWAARPGPAATAIAAALTEAAACAEAPRALDVSASPATLALLGDYVQHLRRLAGVPLAIVSLQEADALSLFADPADRHNYACDLLGGKEALQHFPAGFEETACRILERADPKHLIYAQFAPDEKTGKRCTHGLILVGNPADFKGTYEHTLACHLGLPAEAVSLKGSPEAWLRVFLCHEAGHMRIGKDRSMLPGATLRELGDEEAQADDFAAALAPLPGAAAAVYRDHKEVMTTLRHVRVMLALTQPYPDPYLASFNLPLPGEKPRPQATPQALHDKALAVRSALSSKIRPPFTSALGDLHDVSHYPAAHWFFHHMRETAYTLQRFEGADHRLGAELLRYAEAHQRGQTPQELAQQAQAFPGVVRFAKEYAFSRAVFARPKVLYRAAGELLKEGTFAGDAVAEQMLKDLKACLASLCPQQVLPPTIPRHKTASSSRSPRA